MRQGITASLRVAIVLAVLACALPAWCQGARYHDCVVVVLDASGSMNSPMGKSGKAKMAVAKSALKEVLLQVPESTHAGLLVFGGKTIREPWVYPLGPRDDEALAKAVDRPQPSGKTPLGRYIKIGADRLLYERTKQFGYGSYRLLVVTDGEATDRQLLEKHVPLVLARGITVDVVGVDMKDEHTLAKKVHSYRRADDPAALRKALADVLAEVSVSDTAGTGEEAFDLLAAIPLELGAAMIEALSHMDNRPIGAARLPVKQKPTVQRPPRRPQPAKPARPPQPVRQAPAKEKSGWLGPLVAVAIMLVVVASIVRRRH